MPDRPDSESGPAKLFLIDGSLYVFRAWQSSAVQWAADGRPCNATRGFATWLLSVFEVAADQPVACFFDAHDGNSLRRHIHPSYKADRPAVDPVLLAQITDCGSLCQQLGLPTLHARDGLEADDLMAACALIARDAGAGVTVISGDKDLAQITTDERDHWWDAGKRDPLGPRDIEKRFGISPEQIPDWLALAGDASDNIAGVPGVGAPTAARLLKRWGDLDGLYANLEHVPGMRFRGAPRVAALLAEHEHAVRLARRLTGALPVDGLPAAEQLFTADPPVAAERLTEFGLGLKLAEALCSRQSRA